MVAKDFDVGDLVWAKMKGFPIWPAKIAEPSAANAPAKPGTPKKPQHLVFFFGTENYAWIADENIIPHSEEMLESCGNKKSASIRKAIDKMLEDNKVSESTMKLDSAERESPKKSPQSVKSAEKKIVKTPKAKVKDEKMYKKAPQKRHLSDETIKTSTPVRKATKSSDDFSGLISNTPPNIGYNRVAVIRPLDEVSNSHVASGINKRAYYELAPEPALDLGKSSASLQAKNIKPTDKMIGFMGLGMMGQRIIKNLMNSNHKVTIWDRMRSKRADFVKAGAKEADTPADLVALCDIIFCCVSSPDAAKSLVFGNCGIISGLEKCIPRSKGYVEMTSIDPTTSQEIAEAITHKGGRYLEAPISGSKQLAEEGALLILGAGDRELFNSCETCFFAISKHAYFLSCEVGSGSKMNLILSMLKGTTFAALAEAMALVERCNLSPTNFLEILDLGPLSCPLLMDKGQSMHARNFATNTSLKYQQKDLNLALSLGDLCQQPMHVASAANELFKRAKLLRYSDHDVSAVFLGVKY